jgi:hypothetical protein
MESSSFNQTCSYLRPQEMVRVRLITGRELTGFLLGYSKATNFDGSLELETRQGIIQLLSSSIESIDLAHNQQA